MSATVLITRPREDAERLADALRAAHQGVGVIIASVMEIVPRSFAPVQGQPDMILLTSRHAVEAAISFGDLPVICVGDATAEAARERGLDAKSVAGTADDLVAAVIASSARAPLHLRGYHTRGDVTARLCAAGLEADERVVYAQEAVAWDADTQARVSLAPSLVVPLFSPRNAKLVAARLTETCAADLHLVCISKATLDAWDGPTPLSQTVAARPDFTSMITAIGSQIV